MIWVWLASVIRIHVRAAVKSLKRPPRPKALGSIISRKSLEISFVLYLEYIIKQNISRSFASSHFYGKNSWQQISLTQQLISFLLAQIRSVNINNREDCGGEERIESKIKNSWGCCFVFIFIYSAPAYFIVCSQKVDLHIARSFLLPPSSFSCSCFSSARHGIKVSRSFSPCAAPRNSSVQKINNDGDGKIRNKLFICHWTNVKLSSRLNWKKRVVALILSTNSQIYTFSLANIIEQCRWKWNKL